MSGTKLKEYSIDGHKFEIQVSDSGEFQAHVLGEWVNAPSLKGLTDKLRTMIRRAGRIAVPATIIANRYRNSKEIPEITHVTITGAHGSNRNILYKEDKSGASGQSGYGDTFYRRLSDADIAKFTALVKAHEKAETDLEAWKEKHVVNAYELLQEAAEKVEGTPAEAPTP